MKNDTVSVREAAVLLGVTLTQVYMILWAGRFLNTRKVAGVWVIPLSSVALYSDTRQRGTQFPECTDSAPDPFDPLDHWDNVANQRTQFLDKVDGRRRFE